MSRNRRPRATAYQTIQTNRRRKLRKIPILLFIMMVALVIICSVALRQYTNIQNAYYEYIYEDDLEILPHEPLTHNPAVNVLIAGIDYLESGRIGPEEVDIIDIISVDPANAHSAHIQFSNQLKVDSNPDALTLGSVYTNQGVKAVTNVVDGFTQVESDYYVMLRLSELRTVVDVLGEVDIQLDEAIDVADVSMRPGETKQLNGRQIELLNQRQVDEAEADFIHRQRQLLIQVMQAFFSWEHVWDYPAYLKELETVVQSDVPFWQWVYLIRPSCQEALQNTTQLQVDETNVADLSKNDAAISEEVRKLLVPTDYEN